MVQWVAGFGCKDGDGTAGSARCSGKVILTNRQGLASSDREFSMTGVKLEFNPELL